jgi:hypothetical protein
MGGILQSPNHRADIKIGHGSAPIAIVSAALQGRKFRALMLERVRLLTLFKSRTHIRPTAREAGRHRCPSPNWSASAIAGGGGHTLHT